jgi:DNA-binding CsgD family transcriptional regulator
MRPRETGVQDQVATWQTAFPIGLLTAMLEFSARHGLSTRERQASSLFALGLCDKEASSILSLKEKTLYRYLERACLKTASRDRGALRRLITEFLAENWERAPIAANAAIAFFDRPRSKASKGTLAEHRFRLDSST